MQAGPSCAGAVPRPVLVPRVADRDRLARPRRSQRPESTAASWPVCERRAASRPVTVIDRMTGTALEAAIVDAAWAIVVEDPVPDEADERYAAVEPSLPRAGFRTAPTEVVGS